MKVLIATLIILVSGCATTTEPEATPTEYKTYTQDDLYMSKRETIKSCIIELMDRQAHVLDATQSCSHIYGLVPNNQRVKTLGN